MLEVLEQVGGVSQVHSEQDFYEAGMASVQALPLLMELETRFNITIPDDQFIAARSPRALCSVILSATEQAAG